MNYAAIRTYERNLHKEFEKIKGLMKRTWGAAPNVTIALELRPVVQANFNIKGFQHDGRKIFLNQKSMQNGRKAHLVAREIAAEVTSHRNTCGDCGERVPSIHQREWHAQAILDKIAGKEDRYLDLKDFEYEYELPTGRKTKRGYDEHRRKYLPLMPADVVERYLHPVYAKRIDQALSALKSYRENPTQHRRCTVRERHSKGQVPMATTTRTVKGNGRDMCALCARAYDRAVMQFGAAS